MIRRKLPASEWHECPECRYPMVRWEKFQQNPERVWVVWEPESWKLPWKLILAGVLAVLVVVYLPRFGLLPMVLFSGRGGRLAEYLGNAVGVLGAVAFAYAEFTWRRKRREVLSEQLRAQDWVCAKCLRVEHEVHP